MNRQVSLAVEYAHWPEEYEREYLTKATSENFTGKSSRSPSWKNHIRLSLL